MIERFLNVCRKVNTNVITPTNHNRSKQCDDPISGQLLESWLAQTICLKASKPVRFYGSQRWLALTMLRETRARVPSSYL